MKILVTGGAGYLGLEVCKVLHSIHDVTVVDNLSYTDEFFHPYKFIFGDLSNEEFSKRLYNENYDLVIFLAGIVGDYACAVHKEKAHDINVKAVELLTKYHKNKIIFSSSCSVYGESEQLITEESKTNPLSSYAEQKLLAEKELLKHDSTIFRFGTLYGVSYGRFRNDLVINTLTLRACAHNKITIFNGNQWRPFIHVADVANTIKQNIYSLQKGVFNLLSDNLKIIEIGKLIKNNLPKLKIEIKEAQFEDTRNYRVNNKKLTDNFIFTPNNTVQTGIQEIISLYNSGRIKNFSNIKYSNLGRLEFII